MSQDRDGDDPEVREDREVPAAGFAGTAGDMAAPHAAPLRPAGDTMAVPHALRLGPADETMAVTRAAPHALRLGPADETMTMAPRARRAGAPPGTPSTTPSGAPSSAPSSAPPLPERYRDLGRIAAGGFGEIRRVHDVELDRVVAMKLLRADVAGDGRLEARFLAEAKLTAGLEHPGIVGVHDRGRLADGRVWFTMREVRGRTLGDVIEEVHAAAGPDGFRETGSGWTFRRLADAFARVCQAVAYAHRRGIVHRDLKPDNIMVGELGEALVMDWGLGRRVGAGGAGDAGDAGDAMDDGVDEPSVDTASPQLTQLGDVLGTPVYMPPEQALGLRELHGLPSDVYALGAVLYHLLAGRPPYEGGSAIAVLGQVLTGPPAPVVEAAEGKPVPAELAAICERAMQRDMAARYPDAEALAREVLAWLDGARRREQALDVVARARAMEPEIAALRAQAAEHRAEAKQLLAPVRTFDPVESKLVGWEREDEAERLAREAALGETRWMEEVHGALAIDPALPEAHALLADHYRERLADAELAHRDEDAARFEVLLRAHDRGRHAAFLSGMGALTLVTDPPGARVSLYRYATRQRRQVPELVGEIGPTPIAEMALARGSYLLRISAPGREEVTYPVLIERGAHWNGIPPGGVEPYPVRLPRTGELGADEVYVPAGWCWTGGDPAAMDGLPRRQVWIDGFVLGRFPVTNAEYIGFLDALVASGREDEALAVCPRVRGGLSEGGELVYGRDPDGRFVLVEGVGRESEPSFPVVLVDWHGAAAFARWHAARAGLPFRLPDELEREKAARGADGRLFPWGNHFDATWACVIDSHTGDPARVAVDAFPLDESPYGVRGLAGNVADWCANVWTREGPEVRGGRLRVAPAAPGDPELRAVRGNAWTSLAEQSRAAARFAARPGRRWTTTGLRLARSLSGG